MRDVDPPVRAAAERVLAYLAETDPLPAGAVDAIIGFGVFDLVLPCFCGDLFHAGAAPRIIFTGGIGAGTGTLGGREADVWRETLHHVHPWIPDAAVITENRSTNTAENIAFTAELLEREHPALAFGRGIRRVIVVASPSRLRRVRLTLRQQLPEVHVTRRIPRLNLDIESTLYSANGQNYLEHLCGELDRILEYPKRGWIAAEPLPLEIKAAHAELRVAISRHV
jgi:uncharacterized SAM-binding protein YcdF (DUF218 family)